MMIGSICIYNKNEIERIHNKIDIKLKYIVKPIYYRFYKTKNEI